MISQGQLNELKYDLQNLANKYGVSFYGSLRLVDGTDLQPPALLCDFEIAGNGSVWIIEKIEPAVLQGMIFSFGKGTKFDWKIEGQEDGARIEIAKSQDEDVLVEWCERRGLDVSVQS